MGVLGDNLDLKSGGVEHVQVRLHVDVVGHVVALINQLPGGSGRDDVELKRGGEADAVACEQVQDLRRRRATPRYLVDVARRQAEEQVRALIGVCVRLDGDFVGDGRVGPRVQQGPVGVGGRDHHLEFVG